MSEWKAWCLALAIGIITLFVFIALDIVFGLADPLMSTVFGIAVLALARTYEGK